MAAQKLLYKTNPNLSQSIKPCILSSSQDGRHTPPALCMKMSRSRVKAADIRTCLAPSCYSGFRPTAQSPIYQAIRLPLLLQVRTPIHRREFK